MALLYTLQNFSDNVEVIEVDIRWVKYWFRVFVNYPYSGNSLIGKTICCLHHLFSEYRIKCLGDIYNQWWCLGIFCFFHALLRLFDGYSESVIMWFQVGSLSSISPLFLLYTALFHPRTILSNFLVLHISVGSFHFWHLFSWLVGFSFVLEFFFFLLIHLQSTIPSLSLILLI